MKHSWSTTLILLTLFVLSQLIGLFVLAYDAHPVEKTPGVITVEYSDTALGERPNIDASTTTAYLIGGVIIATILLLVLVRYRHMKIWKVWYFLAVATSLTIAFGVFLNDAVAGILGIGLAYFKIFRPNPIIHNTTEIIMYTGIALLFVPLLTPQWMILLLVLISIYDAYAVWKSKHMVEMAKFTLESKIFPGLNISNFNTVPSNKGSGKKAAILGGGDIAFPLLFAGVVLDALIMGGATKSFAYVSTLIVVVCTTLALFILFLKSEKGKFYPAMPIISAGCLIGYGLLLLL